MVTYPLTSNSMFINKYCTRMTALLLNQTTILGANIHSLLILLIQTEYKLKTQSPHHRVLFCHAPLILIIIHLRNIVQNNFQNTQWSCDTEEISISLHGLFRISEEMKGTQYHHCKMLFDAEIS